VVPGEDEPAGYQGFMTQSVLEPRSLSQWLSLVETRELRVGVIGLGYVGLPLVLLFSQQGFRVTGFDIDASKVDRLNLGESYIHRIDPQQIQAAQEKGFRATADFSQIGEVDAILICVPTPLSDHRTPDMSYIAATMESIVGHLRSGQLVVLESTTYPGTTEEIIAPAIERAGSLKVVRETMLNDGVMVAYSPEREDPGNTSIDRRDIPKVVGGLGSIAAEATHALYQAAFRRVIRVSSPAAAEMTKLLENIYRCVNIALVNELKLLCLRMGIDIWEVIGAAATKPFGFQPFYPGPGLGGHCIPIDPFYLSWKAKEFDFSTRFIELAGEVNEAMPYHVVAAVSSALNQRGKPLKGSRVLVLGLAYKRDVDDLRESPSLSIIEMLQQEGATVSYNDPYFPSVGRGRKYNLNMQSQPLESLGAYDCILIVTDHTSYDYARIVEESQLVVDSRNATRGLTSEKIVRC
jgi:UDP-N-acetyl-D-glucosamine dehydrogenase